MIIEDPKLIMLTPKSTSASALISPGDTIGSAALYIRTDECTLTINMQRPLNGNPNHHIQQLLQLRNQINDAVDAALEAHGHDSN